MNKRRRRSSSRKRGGKRSERFGFQSYVLVRFSCSNHRPFKEQGFVCIRIRVYAIWRGCFQHVTWHRLHSECTILQWDLHTCFSRTHGRCIRLPPSLQITLVSRISRPLSYYYSSVPKWGSQGRVKLHCGTFVRVT